MSEEPKHQQPYKSLGHRLRRMRENRHQSVAEVSGAVEIEPETLHRIEQGEHCPSEDVLLLLISHFNTQEEEAVSLWELAGYSQDRMTNHGTSSMSADDSNAIKPIVMVMQSDTRIMYTDMVNVTINDYGVVMNFLQNQGPGQPSVVSRMGMSREHAKSVLHVLQQTLAHTEPTPKALPAPRQSSPDDISKS